MWLRRFSPVALPAEARSGFACQARGTTNLGGGACAALRPGLRFGPDGGPAFRRRCEIQHPGLCEIQAPEMLSGSSVSRTLRYGEISQRGCGEIPQRAGCPAGQASRGNYTSCGLPGPPRLAGKYPIERVARSAKPRGDISHRAGYSVGQASRGNFTSSGSPGRPRLAGKFPIERVARPARPRGDISHRAGCPVRQGSRGYFASCGLLGRPRLVGIFHMSSRTGALGRSRGNLAFDGSSAFRSILVVCAGIFCVGCSVGLALPIWSTSG